MDPSSPMFLLRVMLLRHIQRTQVCLFFKNVVELYPLPPSKYCLKFLLQSWWAMYSLTTSYCAGISQAPGNTFLFNSTKISFHLKVTFMKFPFEKHYFLGFYYFQHIYLHLGMFPKGALRNYCILIGSRGNTSIEGPDTATWRTNEGN